MSAPVDIAVSIDAPTRCAVVRWPAWPVVAGLMARPDLPSDSPAAVLYANRVLAVSNAAAADGVQVGHRRREAQRACPSLVIVDYRPDHDARTFELVIQAIEDLVPLVEVSVPGVCTFATRGPSRYHGGDAALAALVIQRVLAATPPAWRHVAGPPVVGIADGAFAAQLGAGFVVPVGASATFLGTRPIHDLPVEHHGFVSLLTRLGVHKLGDLAGLARSDVLARFGSAGELAHRLACGLEARPLVARQPVPDLTVEVIFENPVPTTGPVAFAAKQLADELVARLTSQGLACPALIVVAETDHGERHERQWRHELAFRPPAIAERVRWQLDGWAQSTRPPTAGITLLRLVPVEVVPAIGIQEGFWGGRSHADDRAERGIARLVGLLGHDDVLVPEWRGGRHPESQFALVSAALVSGSDVTGAGSGRLVAAPTGEGPWPGALPAPSPATMHNAVVELLDVDGQTIRVNGRNIMSASPATLVDAARRSHVVVGWAGPWPVEERWWDAERQTRRARCQILLESGDAFLVVVENAIWCRCATYD